MKKIIKQINIIIITSIILISPQCFWWILTYLSTNSLYNYSTDSLYENYQAWYSKYQQQDYKWAIEILEPTNESCDDQYLCQRIKDLLKYCYRDLWNQYFDEKNYTNANKYFQESFKLD